MKVWHIEFYSLPTDRCEAPKSLAAWYAIQGAKTKAVDDTEQAGDDGAKISAKCLVEHYSLKHKDKN
jgi:hypothetical protein